ELLEAHRILKPGGRLIVDFPRFWVPEGRHHWWPVQHLWMLDAEQLVELLERVGFTVASVEDPISGLPSRIRVEAVKPEAARARLLLLPGIGDIYWVAVKLAGWSAAYRPQVAIWNFDGRPRSLEYVRRIPFF